MQLSLAPFTLDKNLTSTPLKSGRQQVNSCLCSVRVEYERENKKNNHLNVITGLQDLVC